jgi:hypothetical protein
MKERDMADISRVDLTVMGRYGRYDERGKKRQRESGEGTGTGLGQT